MKDYFLNLISYESWANKEVINFILKIPQLPEKALSIMSHIINAQILWLSRLQGIPEEVKVWQSYDINELIKIYDKSESQLNNYIKNLEENYLDNYIDYTNTKGEKFKSKVKDVLTHLTHHSAYHRGQIIILLKNLSPNVPYTDYIHYERSVKN